jgi:putative membrane protein
MTDVPHSDSAKAQVIAHDRDAVIRTVLANQRTFLAYIRTALTLFVAGVTFVKFFESLVVVIIGWIFIPLGVATFFVGLWRYNVLRMWLRRAEKMP